MYTAVDEMELDLNHLFHESNLNLNLTPNAISLKEESSIVVR